MLDRLKGELVPGRERMLTAPWLPVTRDDVHEGFCGSGGWGGEARALEWRRDALQAMYERRITAGGGAYDIWTLAPCAHA